MKKINVVLISPNKKFLKNTIRNLNFDNVNLIAKIMDDFDTEFFRLAETLNQIGKSLWFIDGGEKFNQFKTTLLKNGVTEENIFNADLIENVSAEWLANLHHIEKNGADFFITGSSYTKFGIDLNCIPHAFGRGVNLSAENQTLQQSYLTAKRVFENVTPGTIKLVFIGLEPYPVRCDVGDLFSDDVKNVLNKPTAKKADLNFECVKKNFKQQFPKEATIDLESKDLLSAEILEKYFSLCQENGAIPVCIVLPVEPTLRKTYSANVLKHFHQTIDDVRKNYKSVFVDLLDVKLTEDYFHDKIHLNLVGATATSALLSEKLYREKLISSEEILNMDNEYFNTLLTVFPEDYKTLVSNIFGEMACKDFKALSKTLPKDKCKKLMVNVFSGMTYNYLAVLSDILSKDDYNELTEAIFKISLESIRLKNKIKVAFSFEHSSKWCGDELYNFFAKDKRFEPTIFFYVVGNAFARKELSKDLTKFKSRGLNVVQIKNSTPIPEQDILIQMSPYDNGPPAFWLSNLKVKTLLVYIPYSHSISSRQGFFYSNYFFRVLWKMFSPSNVALEYLNDMCKVGMPRGVYSGYPKMDIFFKKNNKFSFDWKMARPDAKKIIWAPHHSITDNSLKYATFQWNYKFMYEFAKAHPETSWVVKPHPLLFGSAVKTKLFPSNEACKEYFKKWDDLPNAQVYLGAYYQDIFATSDGMILDSGSFIAEYQYVNKPMIFLTREGEKFNELGEEILKSSYLVDGQNFDEIAETMQRVFIKGKDDKITERKKIFDKYLNYPKYIGMLASEFIYKNINEEFK